MIIQPKIRGFICTTTHPIGCEANVKAQINYTLNQGKIAHAPKRVLVIGSSSGYGLSSRIAAAFGGDAATIGVFLKSQELRKSQVLRVGIIQRHSISMPKKRVCIRKASTVMLFQMRQNKKPLI